MKYDFTKIKCYDIDGTLNKKVKLHRSIGQALYSFTGNLDLVDIAMQMHKGVAVELRDSDIAEIRRVVKEPKSGFYAFAIKAIFDFLDKEQDNGTQKRDDLPKRKGGPQKAPKKK